MRPVNGRLLAVNSLSACRIAGAGLFIVLASEESASLRFAGLGLLVVLLATDILDGHLARRWTLKTDLGYILDGLGDRALYMSILLVLMEARLVLASTVFLIIFRDLLLYGMRALWSDWKRLISSGRTESKLNALCLRAALGIKLSILYSSDLEISILRSTQWRLTAGVALATYVLLSYVLLFSFGRRLLHALFPEDKANENRQ